MQEHDWPGNVRELSNTLEQVFLIGGGKITAGLFRSELAQFPGRPGRIGSERPNLGNFQEAVNPAEQESLACPARSRRQQTGRSDCPRHEVLNLAREAGQTWFGLNGGRGRIAAALTFHLVR